MSSPFWQETRAQAARWFVHSRRRPMVVVSGLFQPVIWLGLFALVFRHSPMARLGGAAGYLGFITPGALLFTALNASLNAGIPVLFDRELGFLDRLCVAPLADRFSIALASAIHIFSMTLLQCLIILAGTALLGVSFQGGLMGWLVLGTVLALVTMGFTAISLALAFLFKQHFEMIAFVMLVTLPLIFLSSAFAPIDYLPDWLRHLVLLNPVTLGVEPLRLVYLHADWSLGGAVLEDSLVGSVSSWHCLAGLALFTALAVLLNRRVLSRRLRGR
ncbi:MAG: ABC transporter permease [Planctomycetota bacterium]